MAGPRGAGVIIQVNFDSQTKGVNTRLVPGELESLVKVVPNCETIGEHTYDGSQGSNSKTDSCGSHLYGCCLDR